MSAEAVARLVLKSEGIDIPSARRESFVERLMILLELPDLVRIGKAVDMAVEHERIFGNARILTDIRPVFPEEAAKGPIAAVISHLLKIEYLNGEEGTKSFFVALDDTDIQKLQLVLNRAIEKREALREFLTGTDLPVWDMGDQKE